MSGGTKDYLKALAKTDVEEYRKVFAKFREETKGVVGRGKKKGSFNVLQYLEGTDLRKRGREVAGFTAFTQSQYIKHFTSSPHLADDELLTEAEAQLAWLRDKKNPEIEKASGCPVQK